MGAREMNRAINRLEHYAGSAAFHRQGSGGALGGQLAIANMTTKVGQQFAGTLTMQLLEPHLRQDLRRSLADAIVAKAVFPCRARPLDIFRTAVSKAIGPHAGRLAKLLEDCDDPASKRPGKARPEDYYWAVRFAVSRAVAAIQGSLAEMLALGPVAQLLTEPNSRRPTRSPRRRACGSVIP